MPQRILNLRKDLPSSLAVFFVALPLCLGVALASGAPLASGLFAGIIGGVFIGFLSGSEVSVSGPAAGMVAVVLAAITKLGSFEAFLMALLLAGCIQVAAGLFKIGFIASYIPKNIIQGLLTAIGLILILKQIPHAVVLDGNYEGYFSFFQADGENTFTELIRAMDFFNPGAVFISTFSILFLIFWEKSPLQKYKYFPPSLILVLTGILLNALFVAYIPSWAIKVEHLVSVPSLHNGDKLFIFPDFSSLTNPLVWLSALTIAIVASLETLINIEAMDNLDPSKRFTPPNKELFAQGIGNIVGGFFGAIPITSVVVRSSVNIQAGAYSKASTILHGFWLLIGMLFLSGFLNQIPLCSLAAILIMAGYKLAKPTIFKAMYSKGHNQFIPFLATVVSIVLTDLLTGILIGSGVSIFYLLKSNLDHPFLIIEEKRHIGDTMRITLPNQVSFLNKAKIDSLLRKIPKSEKVIIDASQNHYMDPDVVEIFQDFVYTEAHKKDIKVNVLSMRELGEENDHIEFASVLDKKRQQSLRPVEILELLKKGNQRFLEGTPSSKQFERQVQDTSSSQNPMAVIISCIDSRTSPELILDAGLGDLISIRIAGNIISPGIAGSVELACIEIGVKLIIVMGHSNCGAIIQAMKTEQRGNIKFISDEIKPAIATAGIRIVETAGKTEAVNQISMLNLRNSVRKLTDLSPYVKSEIEAGHLGLVAGFYETHTGKVTFDHLEEAMVSKPSENIS